MPPSPSAVAALVAGAIALRMAVGLGPYSGEVEEQKTGSPTRN